MEYKKLSEVADIRLSSVDKKTNNNEKKVRLCNFTDVYYNFDLDSIDSQNFMIATAKNNEIEKFTLRKDDVVITKDSETRDDIGISCHIKDKFGNVLLGYHCALIRPKDGIDGAYLNACLKSKMSRTYFSNQASGSGQRYTLSEIGIGSVKIPIIPIEEQRKIARLVLNINDKIRVNNRINDNLHQLIMDTYMHLFFNKTPNGKFGDLIIENSKSRIQVGEMKGKDGLIPFFTSGDAILRAEIPLISGRNIFMNTGGNADVKFFVGDSSYSTDTWCITGKNNLSDYLYLHLLSIKDELNKKFFKGTSLKHLQKDSLRLKSIYIPTIEELTSFNSIANKCFDKISANSIENDRFMKIRDYLLPLLMNGQVSIV